MSDIVSLDEVRKCKKKDLEQIGIKDTVSQITHHVRENLLLIHAWSGFDTTSTSLGQGKTAISKFVEQSNRT